MLPILQAGVWEQKEQAVVPNKLHVDCGDGQETSVCYAASSHSGAAPGGVIMIVPPPSWMRSMVWKKCVF